MSNQNLSGVGFATQCYTIVFICVSSHNGEVFSFINSLNNRFEFFWDRWGEWKKVLTPYSCHAFLVRSYNTKSDSGMGFKPEAHLCEFLNLNEARVFNSAYLTKYNKMRDTATIDELNDLAGEFGTALLNMAEEREEWLAVCEKSAQSIFSHHLFLEFFGADPIPLEAAHPWDKDMIDPKHFQGWFGEEETSTPS